MKAFLPESLAATVKSAFAEWQSGGKQLWDRDASLWTGEDGVQVAGVAGYRGRSDRVFAYIRLESEADAEQEADFGV